MAWCCSPEVRSVPSVRMRATTMADSARSTAATANTGGTPARSSKTLLNMGPTSVARFSTVVDVTLQAVNSSGDWVSEGSSADWAGQNSV